MVLTHNWIDKLIECYIQSCEHVGEELTYVTSLVNNNPYGFKCLLDSCNTLAQEYYSTYARQHLIGISAKDPNNPYRIVPKETVYDGGFGTIWKLPYIARWLHEKTTMQPEYYIDITRDLPITEVDTRKRYSINCMFFRKELWDEISDGGTDDEGMLHVYCMLNGKRVFADLSVPMVHIAFYSQREEIRDMIPEIRDVFSRFLSLPFPIALCDNKLIEIENRLRFMEKNNAKYYSLLDNSDSNRFVRILTWLPRKIAGGIRCYKKHGWNYTVNRFLVHLKVRKG